MSFEEEIVLLSTSGVSQKRAAEKLGITLSKLITFIDVMGLEWKRGVRETSGGKHVIDGIKGTLESHAVRLGVSVGSLRWRLSKRNSHEGKVKAEPITQEEAQRFTDLRKSGETASKAAEIVGRPYPNLKNAAIRLCPEYADVVAASSKKQKKEENLDLQTKRKVSRKCSVDQETAIRFVSMRDEGIGAKAAAEELGYPCSTLLYAAKKYAITDQACTAISQEDVTLFIKMRREGVSTKEASGKIGRSYHGLSKAAKRLDPNYLTRKATSREDAEKFLDLRKQGVKTLMAAEIIGRPYTTLTNAVRKFIPEYSSEKSDIKVDAELFIELRGKGIGAHEAAGIVGRSYYTLRKAVIRLFPAEQSITRIEGFNPGRFIDISSRQEGFMSADSSNSSDEVPGEMKKVA